MRHRPGFGNLEGDRIRRPAGFRRSQQRRRAAFSELILWLAEPPVPREILAEDQGGTDPES